MFKIVGLAAAVFFVFVDAASGAATTQKPVVSACLAEAQTSHDWAWQMEPSLRPMIETQRKRLTDVCVSLSSARGEDAQELLSECLREAAAGPRHIQRGRDMDAAHVARQRAACRAVVSAR